MGYYGMKNNLCIDYGLSESDTRKCKRWLDSGFFGDFDYTLFKKYMDYVENGDHTLNNFKQGIHEGFPLCCVIWYTLWVEDKLFKWFQCEDYTIDNSHSEYTVKDLEYVPCPKCVVKYIKK